MALAGLLAVSISFRPPVARAQRPWEGWYGPPADGVFGFRFGMDRFTVEDIAKELGLDRRSSRPGTLRYQGRLAESRGELLAEFHDDTVGGLGGRLMRITVRWSDFAGNPQPARKLFQRLDRLLQRRYGDALVKRDDGFSSVITSSGSLLHLYRGPEMQAFVELQAPQQEHYVVILTLQYPPLDPKVAPEG